MKNELEIMATAGKHPNLVSLLGACTETGRQQLALKTFSSVNSGRTYDLNSDVIVKRSLLSRIERLSCLKYPMTLLTLHLQYIRGFQNDQALLGTEATYTECT